jgi:hypothetical protein
MNSDTRQHLFNLGEQAARELERYVKIYDLKFDRTNFVDIYEAKMKRTDEILSSYDSMISALEIIAKDLEERTVEYDYSYSLGNYICEITKTINTYQHRLRIIKHHQINGNRFKGIWSLLKNNHEHDKHQKSYLNHGMNLTALWGIMKNT